MMEKITQRAAQANGTSASKQIVVGGKKQERDREEEVKSGPDPPHPFLRDLDGVILITLMFFLGKEGKAFDKNLIICFYI